MKYPADDLTAARKYFILSNQSFPIPIIGDYANDLLLPDTEGIVLATFSKVVYLRHASDEIIWLIQEGLPMHRRAIQCVGSLPATSVNTPYIMKNKALVLESGSSLDFRFTKIWGTPAVSPEHALPIMDIIEHLDLFLSSMNDLPSPTGLGIFIPEILNLTQDHSKIDTTKNLELTPSQRYARTNINHIARACLIQDIDGIFEQGEELIGLGEGLTPSGDDFMGGLLFCIRTLQDLYKPFHPSVFSKEEEFLEKSKSRTNLISYTILKDHANGFASETLHEFIHAILTSQDREHLRYIASDMIHIGHSTGWDLLTGVLAGTLLIFNKEAPNTFWSDPISSHYSL
jgi:hypothetical protein